MLGCRFLVRRILVLGGSGDYFDVADTVICLNMYQLTDVTRAAKQIAGRRKTMFRAKLAEAFCGEDGPAWAKQLLSPESLARTGYFDPEGIARFQKRLGGTRLSTARPFLDMGLMCAISTQLWHHTYCGGGLCELSTYEAH